MNILWEQCESRAICCNPISLNPLWWSRKNSLPVRRSCADITVTTKAKAYFSLTSLELNVSWSLCGILSPSQRWSKTWWWVFIPYNVVTDFQGVKAEWNKQSLNISSHRWHISVMFTFCLLMRYVAKPNSKRTGTNKPSIGKVNNYCTINCTNHMVVVALI